MNIINTILNEQGGWAIISDTVGRYGQRMVVANRVVNGITTCVAELREGTRRVYVDGRWEVVGTHAWCEPHLRPCFAPGVIA